MSDRSYLMREDGTNEDAHYSESAISANDQPQTIALLSTTSRLCRWIPRRYVMAVLLMLGFFVSFTQRLVINIALVAMVNFTDTVYSNQTSGDYCPVDNSTKQHLNYTIRGEFNWNPNLQAYILGAFYYGYPVSQLMFGLLAERFGNKAIFAFNGFVCGGLSLLIPTVARWSPYALLAVRIVQGLVQGCLYPTTLATWSRWGPEGERSALYSFTNSGGTLGNIIALAVTGVLCQTTFLGGWPSAFYLFGTLSIVWAICWLWLGYSTPKQHPRITQQELHKITKETDDLAGVQYLSPPWRSIGKSVPTWAIFIFLFTNNTGFYTLATSLPLYLKHVLNFDMSQDGLMSALPFLLQWPFVFIAGSLADYLRRKKILRVITIRRIGAFIGLFLPGVFLMLVAFVGCSRTAAISMLILSYFSNAFNMMSGELSLFDIAPLYAGSIMGLMNGISNTNGFLIPILIAAITQNSGDRMRWRTVFYIGTAAYTVGTLIYCVFITDKEQHWAKGETRQQGNDKDS